MSDLFLTDRLYNLLNDFNSRFNDNEFDPWFVGKLPMDCKHTISKPYNPIEDENWTALDHARRIKWLYKHTDELYVPIDVDFIYDGLTEIDFGILDGNHRFYAHWYYQIEWINVNYSGYEKYFDYLTGKTNTYR